MNHLRTCQYSLAHRRTQHCTECTARCQRCNSSYLTFAWKLLNAIKNTSATTPCKAIPPKSVFSQQNHAGNKEEEMAWTNNCNLTAYALDTCWFHYRVTRESLHYSCVMLCENHWQPSSSYRKKKDPQSNPGLSCQQPPRNYSTFIYC